MKNACTLGGVLEMAAKLSMDEKQECVDILRKRLVEERRNQIAAEIEEGRREFKEGKLKMTTLENLMQEILK
ncbi:MAG: hypothetical protein WCP55_23935 [Lentisphaerota bacterium]